MFLCSTPTLISSEDRHRFKNQEGNSSIPKKSCFAENCFGLNKTVGQAYPCPFFLAILSKMAIHSFLEQFHEFGGCLSVLLWHIETLKYGAVQVMSIGPGWWRELIWCRIFGHKLQPTFLIETQGDFYEIDDALLCCNCGQVTRGNGLMKGLQL